MAVAFELLELGIAIRGERFRREHPGCTDAEVDEAVQTWLLERPGAPWGDAIGRSVTFPRSS